MIRPVQMYYCTCDNCNKEHKEYGEFVAFETKDKAKDAALSDGWIEIDNKMYCPDCCEYDEVEDCYKPILEV